VSLALEGARRLTDAGIRASVANVRRLHPLDAGVLAPLLAAHPAVITVEDNALAGGFGSAVLEFMADKAITRPVERLGLPDAFVEQGPLKLLRRDVGLTVEAIVEAAARLVHAPDACRS